MKSFQLLVAVLLLVLSPLVLAGKPDPSLPNPPLQVWIAGGEVIDADVIVQNEVEIKNDTGNPIPVDVGQPIVHVANMPTVLEPEPFQSFQQKYTFSSGNGGGKLIYTVPSDRRLVIEFISAYIHLGDPVNRLAEFSILTSDAELHVPPLTLFHVDNGIFDKGAYYRGSQLVKIHADPDTQVLVDISAANNCLDGCTFSTTISGYLIQVD